jgi:hypothetical protein
MLKLGWENPCWTAVQIFFEQEITVISAVTSIKVEPVLSYLYQLVISSDQLPRRPEEHFSTLLAVSPLAPHARNNILCHFRALR